MAIANAVKRGISSVTLELSREEALTLYHLTRRVSESPNVVYGSKTTVKRHTDQIRDALRGAFADEISPYQMESPQVWGGNMPARTESLKYLDPKNG